MLLFNANYFRPHQQWKFESDDYEETLDVGVVWRCNGCAWGLLCLLTQHPTPHDDAYPPRATEFGLAPFPCTTRQFTIGHLHVRVTIFPRKMCQDLFYTIDINNKPENLCKNHGTTCKTTDEEIKVRFKRLSSGKRLKIFIISFFVLWVILRLHILLMQWYFVAFSQVYPVVIPILRWDIRGWWKFRLAESLGNLG